MFYCISFGFSFPLFPLLSLPVAIKEDLEDTCSSKPVRGGKGQTSEQRPSVGVMFSCKDERPGSSGHKGCFPLVFRGLGWAVQSRCHRGPGLLPAVGPLSWLDARHCVYAPGEKTGSYGCAGERQRPVELVSWTLHPVIFVSICSHQPALVPRATSNHKDISEKGGFLTEYHCPK